MYSRHEVNASDGGSVFLGKEREGSAKHNQRATAKDASL